MARDEHRVSGGLGSASLSSLHMTSQVNTPIESTYPLWSASTRRAPDERTLRPRAAVQHCPALDRTNAACAVHATLQVTSCRP